MPLHLRLRGSVYHARGTVHLGSKTVDVPSFSTGARTLADAEAVVAKEAARIRDEILDGSLGGAKKLSIADAFEAYLTRPGGSKIYDSTRISMFNAAMGHRPMAEAPEAWQAWLNAHGDHTPATAARNRNILLAALRHACKANGIPAPALPGVKQPRSERVVFLADAERAALLRSYNPHASCPVLLLAYQGMRTQEALQLDWRNVDLARETIRIAADQSKTARGRAVPMHPKVLMLLRGMWHSAGQPYAGLVFRSSRGEPWTDTRGRDGSTQGGNPLTSAHETACRAAKVTDFRVHDWRHDWAARMVMGGVDLYTLMRVGGWTSLRMVERYASVSADHARSALAKLK